MTFVPQDVLAVPAVYRGFQDLIRRRETINRTINDILKIKPGEAILDIGCGPCALFGHMPPVSYCGMDMSAEYIASAHAAYGDNGRFLVGSVSENTSFDDVGRFDLVMALGLLHHIDDAVASSFLGAAKRALKPGGRVVTVDNVFVPRQNLIARTLISMDRGEHVRGPEGYQTIAAAHFQTVDVTILHDLLRIPYTHIVMECR